MTDDQRQTLAAIVESFRQTQGQLGTPVEDRELSTFLLSLSGQYRRAAGGVLGEALKIVDKARAQ